MNDTALRLAELIERDYHDETLAPRRAAAELRRLHAENERLIECLKKANDQAEHFEREWYLRGDLNDELVEALRCADAMLLGANMDAKAVERKVSAALAKVEASK